MCWGWRIRRSRWKKLRDTTDWTVEVGARSHSLSPPYSAFICLIVCVVFCLLYWFSSVSRSNSIQLTGSIPFFITLGPPSAPSQSLSSPLNQGQCLSVSEADSIDFRNHSISFSSSHRLATKEKKKTHTLHTPQKKKIDFTCTPQKKNPLYLPPNSSRCAKQSRVPLVAPPSLPALIFFFFFSSSAL